MQLEQRQRVLVVEVLGLRNTTAPPLVDAVPSSIRGIRNSILIDLRQNIVDGEIYQPERALEQVTTLPDQLRQQSSGLDRRDVHVVTGGLAPVPFLFLTGLLIDDESEVDFLDWDRHATTWRELTGIETRLAFLSANLADQAQHPEVALCVSVSYRVNVDTVSTLGYPMVHLELPHRGTDTHWCEADQHRWVQTFLGVLMELEASGVRQVHLFLAAPGSVALRLGRAYDKRNLPAVRVYQHERVGERSTYPWALEMPVSGRSKPAIVTPNGDVISTTNRPSLDATGTI